MANTILGPDEFTAELANRVLADHLPAAVESLQIKPLGEGVGLMSAIARATLTLTDGSVATVIVKYIAQTENAAISKGLNFYANELNFYRHLAANCPIPSPRCLYAELDAETQDFLLILEDLGDDVAGNQLESCSRAVMSKAFQKAGAMHAQYWQQISGWEWLSYHNDAEKNIFRRDAIYQPGVKPTLKLFPEYFTDNLEDCVREIGNRFPELFERAMSAPGTFIHGDYRTDNMLLPGNPDDPEIVAVDWQNSGGGSGTHDIAYFSSQSCGPELRGDIELAELKNYHQALLDGGVEDYSFEQCLEHYRLNLLITMITPIAICGTLDPGNERGMALGEVMLSRSLAALRSMECDQLLF